MHDGLAANREDYDLFITFDETRGRPDIKDRAISWHSEGESAALGLTYRIRPLFWHCGDFPFYFVLRDLSHYGYVIMIEHDVLILKKDFMAILAGKLKSATPGTVDMLGLVLGEYGADSECFDACQRVYGTAWGSYYPFVCLSRRAIVHMFSQRQLEAMRRIDPCDIMHCEAFTASSLKAANFMCCDLNMFLPGSYRLPAMMIHPGGFPGQDFSIAEGTDPVDPVSTLEAYLGRLLSHRRSGKLSLQQYLDLLGSEACRALPAELRESSRAQAMEWAETAGKVEVAPG